MPKIDKISISLFMFALESYLLEKKVIQNIQDIKQLDWEIVENYRNILLIDHPHFTLEKKQLKSFIKHYKDRRKELETRKQPMDLEPVKQLMREYDAAPAPSTVAPAARPRPPAELIQPDRPASSLLMSEIADMRSLVHAHKCACTQLMSEIADMRSQLMSEIADMRSQLMSEMRELRSECVEMRSTLTLSLAPGAAHQLEQHRPRPPAELLQPAQAQALRPRPPAELLQPAQAQLERPGAKHQLEQQRASLARSRPGAAQHTRPEAEASRPSLPDFKAILQSVESPRPFIRARQRVALLVLYLEGLKLSQLLTLDVRHLKELRAVKAGALDQAEAAQGVKAVWAPPTQGETLGRRPSFGSLRATLDGLGEAKDILDDDALGIATDLEILIGDYPDSTPAFRAKAHSARPSTRPGLTSELNQILSKWNCSTKSLVRRTKT